MLKLSFEHTDELTKFSVSVPLDGKRRFVKSYRMESKPHLVISTLTDGEWIPVKDQFHRQMVIELTAALINGANMLTV